MLTILHLQVTKERKMLPRMDDTLKRETWYSLAPKLHMVYLSRAK